MPGHAEAVGPAGQLEAEYGVVVVVVVVVTGDTVVDPETETEPET